MTTELKNFHANGYAFDSATNKASGKDTSINLATIKARIDSNTNPTEIILTTNTNRVFANIEKRLVVRATLSPGTDYVDLPIKLVIKHDCSNTKGEDVLQVSIEHLYFDFFIGKTQAVDLDMAYIEFKTGPTGFNFA